MVLYQGGYYTALKVLKEGASLEKFSRGYLGSYKVNANAKVGAPLKDLFSVQIQTFLTAGQKDSVVKFWLFAVLIAKCQATQMGITLENFTSFSGNSCTVEKSKRTAIF